MALTGLDIYKQLPKTNCKDCGVPTCLAFAMKVASGQAGLDNCPHLTDEARARLDEASAPPQRLVKIGEDASSKSRILGHQRKVDICSRGKVIGDVQVGALHIVVAVEVKTIAGAWRDWYGASQLDAVVGKRSIVP